MKEKAKYKIGILATHPIQYYVPWYKALAEHPSINAKIFYCHRQTPENQAQAGFGVKFKWDVPFFEGYEYSFLPNKAAIPRVDTFFGCDTPEIKEIIAKERFDAFIVHGWRVKSFWQAIIACWKMQIPILVKGDSYLLTNSLFPKRWLKYPLYRWFIPRFNAYLSVGRAASEYYLYYGADKNRLFFVPHAVDNDFFASLSRSFILERDNLHKQWSIPEDAVVFLFAGKLIPKKRPHDFVEALEIASKSSLNVFGLIVGDGPLRAGLEATVKKKNLQASFTGFLNQTEIPKAYTVADALVLPSDVGETWGLVVNEAFACGLPAIISDRAGCVLDLIPSGRTGRAYKCGDIKQLSRALTEFAQDPARLKLMGKEARKKIKEYSIDTAVKNTISAICFAIEEKTRQAIE